MYLFLACYSKKKLLLTAVRKTIKNKYFFLFFFFKLLYKSNLRNKWFSGSLGGTVCDFLGKHWASLTLKTTVNLQYPVKAGNIGSF